MQANTRILTLAVAASMVAMAVPATAVDPDGNFVLTFDFGVALDFDFKDGVGVFEPGGPGNPCPGQRLLGLRVLQPVSHYYQTGRVATNLKGAAGETGVHVDGIAPTPLAPCPLPVVPAQEDIEIWFSGLNIRFLYDAMSSDLNLCSQLIQSTDGGCIPSPETVDLDVAACPFADATFGHLTADGKPDFGVWDVIGGEIGATIWSESIACGGTGFSHAHDYTASVTFFDVNIAGVGFDIIQNADIVHPGSGDQYAVICWTMDYVNLDDGSSVGTASAHDYQLILDLAAASHTASLAAHVGGPSELLRGLYSTAPGAGAGNGNPVGCETDVVSENKKLDLDEPATTPGFCSDVSTTPDDTTCAGNPNCGTGVLIVTPVAGGGGARGQVKCGGAVVADSGNVLVPTVLPFTGTGTKECILVSGFGSVACPSSG